MDILSVIQKEFHKHQNCLHQVRPAFPISPNITDLRITREQYDNLVIWATKKIGKPITNVVTKYYLDDLTLIYKSPDSEPELYFIPEQYHGIAPYNNEDNYFQFRRLFCSQLDNRKFPSIMELNYREQTRDLIFNNRDVEFKVKNLLKDPDSAYQAVGDTSSDFTYELYVKEPAHVATYIRDINQITKSKLGKDSSA